MMSRMRVGWVAALLAFAVPAAAEVVEVRVDAVVAQGPQESGGPRVEVGMPLSLTFTYDSEQAPDFDFGGEDFAEYWNPLLAAHIEVGEFAGALSGDQFSFIDIFNDSRNGELYSDSFTLVAHLQSAPVAGWRTADLHFSLGAEGSEPPRVLSGRGLPEPFPHIDAWGGGTAWIGFVDQAGNEDFIGYEVLAISSSAPEPAEWMLMGAGLLCMAYALRRRARRPSS